MIGVSGAVIVVLQTTLEDRALKNGVSGYTNYAQKVKYRLMEFFW
ncbi:MAG: hypothetical protein Kow002_19660 [Anaerolineales bacterium]